VECEHCDEPDTPHRVADYRPEQERNEIPAACPECGAAITRSESRGCVSVYGPADREAMVPYGITEDGPVTTILWNWHCSADETHCWGPVLIG
jgi:hypothetical protein